MTANELLMILDRHKKWLNNEDGGSRADLSHADLRGANLCHADLRDANLVSANLCGAHMEGTNLYRANLRNAVLHGANLLYANLCGADLNSAELWNANLHGADLFGAYLRHADLLDADLCEADLCEADLTRANLCGANLSGADLMWARLCYAVLRNANLHGVDLCHTDLRYANLRDVKNLSDLSWTSIVPETGSFIGWKKVDMTDMSVIVKLEILADAKRCNATGRKCRCSAAKVLEIQKVDGTPAGLDSVVNCDYMPHTPYVVGETVLADGFNNDRWDEHGYGIHFFITRQEAVNY